jgi:hypothetical protein
MGHDRARYRSAAGRSVALRKRHLYRSRVNWSRLAIALVPVVLAGCGIGRVVTTPVRYVFHEPEPTPAANTSDVTNPGQPVAIPSPTAAPRVASRPSNRPSMSSTSRVAANKPSVKSSPSPSKSAAQFPIAKPVPDRPGLVFNPFNERGAYIDVSGYASGSKVKDPDSQKIFIVP